MVENSELLINFGRQAAWDQAVKDYTDILRIGTPSRFEAGHYGQVQSAATCRAEGLKAVLANLVKSGAIDETDIDSPEKVAVLKSRLGYAYYSGAGNPRRRSLF